MKITLTPKDITTGFADPRNCPMANKLKKVLKRKHICTSAGEVKSRTGIRNIGYLNPPFTAREYDFLKEGKIKKFTTTYTPV